MAKHVSGKTRVWQVGSVWIKRRDGPERVLNAYRLLLGLPPQRARRLAFAPDHRQLATGGTTCAEPPRDPLRSGSQE
jgi:hypothetical protein